MAGSLLPAMLVLASVQEPPTAHRVWGSGGWDPPEQREALDWLTLARLHGWSAAVAHLGQSGNATSGTSASRWLVVARDPDDSPEELAKFLTARLLTAPLLAVTRAGVARRPQAGLTGVWRGEARIRGRRLEWCGPGEPRQWTCRNDLQANALRMPGEASVWATLDGEPVIAAQERGRGVLAVLGFHPSRARDSDGAGSSLLKHLLINGAQAPIAWHDHSGSLVLRMDDPGGAQNVHKRDWSYPELSDVEWQAIGSELARKEARLSVGYVTGWVDDGDSERGSLTVAGRAVDRIAGAVHPAPEVRYEDLAGHRPGTVHRYEHEAMALRALQRNGRASVELHGYTHMHPDREAWSKAEDRYEATPWYRELGAAAASFVGELPPEEHPLVLAVAALERHFGARPTALICPGDEWTDEVLALGLDLGVRLVSSYYLGMSHQNRLCWCTHVCAPYLDQPDAAWFDAEMPVVGYFHDREPALFGAEWLPSWLDAWRAAGARRMIDLRELASTIERSLGLEVTADGLRLRVTDVDLFPLERPVPIGLRCPGTRLPETVDVKHGESISRLSVESSGETGWLVLPPQSLNVREVAQ